MNLKMTAFIATSLLGAASLSLAQTGNTGNDPSDTAKPSMSPPNGGDSSMSSSSGSDTSGKMTHKEFMKECMQMGKSANNGMSRMDMRKSCHSQLKKYETGDQQAPTAPTPNS